MPLFATVEQALAYGETVGLEGYHTHVYRGRLGFMAGESHGIATGDYEGDITSVNGSNDANYTDSDGDSDTLDTGDFSGQGGGDTGPGTGGGGSGGGGYG